MYRKVLKATDGMVLTNGEIYGTEIYLAEGVDESSFYEITNEEYEELSMSEMPESENVNPDEATIDDYKEALARLGVSE